VDVMFFFNVTNGLVPGHAPIPIGTVVVAEPMGVGFLVFRDGLF